MFNKNKLNKIFAKLGFEIHGLGYLKKMQSTSSLKDVLIIINGLSQAQISVIFDVGSNRGLTTQEYLDNFPNATIHAFEPFEEVYTDYLRKFSSNKKVIFNPLALSDKIGISILNINNSVDTNSLLKSKFIGASSDKSCVTMSSTQVHTTTIDEYVMKHRINKIDILKIDVQGNELNVLKGAKIALAENRISMIYLETYFKAQYEDQPLFNDIFSFLYSKGYELQDIYDPYYNKNSILWCDSLFIKSDMF